MADIGKLTKENLREIWPREVGDFTPWLAEEENLKLLLDEIGDYNDDIENVTSEDDSRGDFKPDIVIKREGFDNPIIIENQLEMTDTKHLGQLIVYASGFNARVVVWVVNDVKEKHQNAIDWLNKTTNGIDFFLVKVEVWKINNSLPAPKFNIIVRPNNWSREIRKSVTTPRERDNFIFLNNLKSYASEKKTEFEFHEYRPHKNGIYLDAIKYIRGSVRLTFNPLRSQNKMDARLLISDKNVFDILNSKKDEFEGSVGHDNLNWKNAENGNTYRIDCSCEIDFEDKENYNNYFDKILELGGKLVQAYNQFTN